MLIRYTVDAEEEGRACLRMSSIFQEVTHMPKHSFVERGIRKSSIKAASLPNNSATTSTVRAHKYNTESTSSSTDIMKH